MNLTFKEYQHKIRGHYHYDPSKDTNDIIPYGHCLPADACDEIARTVLEEHEKRGRDPDDPVFLYYDFSRLIKRNFLYKNDVSDQAECVRLDDLKLEYEPWLNNGHDLSRSWGVNVVVRESESTRLVVDHFVKKYNWLGQKDDFQHKIWIQYPGQMTMSHIDHIYGFYEGRTPWDDPCIETKIYSILTSPSPGQMLQWGNNLLTEWKKGYTYTWKWGLPHWTANFSQTPRVSLAWRIPERLDYQVFRLGLGENL